ncbi:MAG TPA: glycerol-3-phosphate dehydrogenase/oxidase [Candidatus Krumholzibacteria bacterium]|nr:glycerol-3-phosphate dehydrogenase/oxidase [Candidatus Krumholzibacteria bacterium]
MREAIRAEKGVFDVLVIGGGATGLGCAYEAVWRGLDVALVDQGDFASGTSSRSTKLFHGGVRYLRGGHVQLVAQSLRERGNARRQARDLVRDTAFLVPAYRAGERFYYSSGLRLYDLLARGSHDGPPRSRTVSRLEALQLAPTLNPDGLRGGVVYYDDQFDDARYALELARAAAANRARLLNYASVTDLLVEDGRIAGARIHDHIYDDVFEVRARAVINAAGVHADEVRRLHDRAAWPLLRMSRGAHIVLERTFLPGDTAILVPRTDDRRVVFVIPWRGRVLVGTTETAVDSPEAEPLATPADVDYLLEHAARYLSPAPSRSDVRSAFAGLRPLPDARGRTANLRRDHRVEVKDGMVTIYGGKWTTYRLMARDAVKAAIHAGKLSPPTPRPVAVELGAPPASNARLETHIISGVTLDAEDEREIERIVRDEMAMTVADILARRTRALFLDARRSADAAPAVATVAARVLGRDSTWAEQQVDSFSKLAAGYLPGGVRNA